MTNEIVVLDSWAWWEILDDTSQGRRLAERYLDARGVRVLTVDITLAEVAAKLARLGRAEDVAPALAGIEAGGAIVPIDAEVAALAAELQLELRRENGHASIADALVLAVARIHEAVLISGDPCFRGLRDVRSS